MDQKLLNKLSKLDKEEKLSLVEALWNSIASDPQDVKVPDHHKSILEKRLESFEKDKNDAQPWHQIRDKYL